MASTANGTPKPSKSAMANGQPSGSVQRASRSRRKSKRTYSGWFLDKGAKLLIWYTLLTAIFRCPSNQTDLTDSSPKICKPYLQARDYVIPYAKPYYDQHVAHHVEKAQPYIERFNQQVYTPGLEAYTKHGAPRVAQAQKYGEEQWEKTVKPQYENARNQAGKQYDASVAPYVKQVQDKVQPYYDDVSTSVKDLWALEVEPVYRNTRPYIEKTYKQADRFTRTTVLPYGQYAGTTAWGFLSRQIWPRLRVLYGENVEPQLMRISERLGRYKDEKKLEAEIKSMESSSSITSASSSAASVAASISSAATEVTSDVVSSASSVIAPSASATKEANAAVKFAEDLQQWREISSKAVEEGADDLKERVAEICSHQVESQAHGTGEALVVQLQETAVGVLNSVKARIQSVVGSLSEDSTQEDIEEANDNLATGIRNAGQNVKVRAQAIREWHHSYKSETDTLVEKALHSTLETIESIRDLRLQEIGRRYANKDITHKDWSKYNDLKKDSSQTWRDSVKAAALEHAGQQDAKAAGDEVEQKGMHIAEEIAKELARLKDVAKWKVNARDATDDFNTKHIPVVAEKAKQAVLGKVSDASEAVAGSSQGSTESATSVASEKASSLASSASGAVAGSSQGSVESVASKASEAVAPSSQGTVESATSKAKDSASAVSESIVGSETPDVETAFSKNKESVQSAVSQASESVMGTPQGSVESATSKASDMASSASESVIGSETPDVEGAFSSNTESVKSAVSEASESMVGSSTPSMDTTSIMSSISSAQSKVADQPLSKSLGPKAASILAAGKSKKDAASKSIKGTQAPGMESYASGASSSASSVASDASSAAGSAASDVSSSISSAASAASEAAPDASQASKKVWGGAMAQAVPSAHSIVLDDDIVDDDAAYSERIQDMANNAMSRASYLTKAIQDAMKPVTSTQGSAESVASLASDQYESAMSAASSALFGTQDMGANFGSMADEKYQQAVTA